MKIRGITVLLHEKTESGRDALNRITYEETVTPVDNVIVGQPSGQEALDTLNLTGRRAVYTLGIPKGDTHDWTDKTVEFFGGRYRTIGAPVEGIEEMVPLSWNKKVQCEAVNGTEG